MPNVLFYTEWSWAQERQNHPVFRSVANRGQLVCNQWVSTVAIRMGTGPSKQESRILGPVPLTCRMMLMCLQLASLSLHLFTCNVKLLE